MGRRTRFLFLLVLALPLAASVPAAGESAPSVSIAADGTTLEDGATHVTTTDPTLSITASVAPDAPDGTRIEVVTVQIDGTPHATFDVNATSVTRTVSPTFHYADSEVKVIVTDTNEDLATTTVTVRKDPRAPWVNLSAPYHSSPGALIPDGEVNRSVVNVTGDVAELNRVEELQLTYDHATSAHHGSIDLERRGRAFSERILLGNGTNRLTIYTRDDLENTQLYEFEVTVNDTDAPTIDLHTRPNETNASAVTLRGTITDAVWVENASATVNGSDTNSSETTQLVPAREYEASTERRSVTFEATVELEAGDNDVTITATDAFGHNATTSLSVTYEEPETDYRLPSVAVDRTRTRFVDARRVHVAGRATGFNLTHVSVEATTTGSGETVGYVLVHDGGPRGSVPLDATVRTGGDVAKLVVRAADERGGLRARILYVNATANITFVGRDGEAEPETRTAARRTVVKTMVREPTTVVQTAAPTPTPAVETVVHTRTTTRTRIERRTVTVTPNASSDRAVIPDVDLPSLGLLPIAGVATLLVAGIGLLVGSRYRQEAAAED